MSNFQTGFSSGAKELINRMVSDKGLIVRELISNSLDAIFKAKTGEKEIWVATKFNNEKKEGTLTITDTGVGMTRD